MDRLFFRVYLHVLAGVFAAALAASVFVAPRLEEQLGRNIENTLSPPIALLAQMLTERSAAHEDPHGLMERASLRLRWPVALIPRAGAGLDGGTLSRLDAGAVVRAGSPRRSMLYARIEGSDQLLQIGPISVEIPMSGWRGAALFFLLVAGLLLGVHLLLRPLRRQLGDLRRTAEALGRGELSARAEVGSRDAVGTLASTLNHMGGEIQRLIATREELLHMTSHELRTPIQRMHFGLESARSARAAPERERAFDRIDRDLAELDQLIEELLTYVRLKERGAPTPEAIDLSPVLEELCEAMSDLARGLTLAGPALDEGVFLVRVEARLIRRAVSNLVGNALRHARSRVEVSVQREGPAVIVNVDDDGPGIPTRERARVFEPFHRLDDACAGSGFGLGLAIVRRIADLHGGEVSALDSALGGARFQLSFPG